MLYSEVMVVCSEINIKHTSSLWGQNIEFVSVKPDGTFSDHWDVKG